MVPMVQIKSKNITNGNDILDMLIIFQDSVLTFRLVLVTALFRLMPRMMPARAYGVRARATRCYLLFT